MPVQLRFRQGWEFIADWKAAGQQYEDKGASSSWYTREQWEAVEPAKPGDVWRLRWYRANDEEGPIAGYSICCIKCGRVHSWTTATNCAQRFQKTVEWDDDEGHHSSTFTTCPHSGEGSCWQWSGSAEEGTLTAQPSLWCQLELGGCGYHGFLTNGVLSDG